MLLPRTASDVLSEIRAAPKKRMSRTGIIVAILAFLVIAFVGYLAIR
jgi:hypothetical protein